MAPHAFPFINAILIACALAFPGLCHSDSPHSQVVSNEASEESRPGIRDEGLSSDGPEFCAFAAGRQNAW
jgi:hypothetical protein